MDLDKMMKFAVEHGVSDLHIQAGAPPMLRIGGQPRFVEGLALTGEETRQYIVVMPLLSQALGAAIRSVPNVEVYHDALHETTF